MSWHIRHISAVTTMTHSEFERIMKIKLYHLYGWSDEQEQKRASIEILIISSISFAHVYFSSIKRFMFLSN